MLERPPEPGEVQSTLGQYQILQSIGKGGMGEVFLAYDTICGRKIALKRIREDLVTFSQIHKRFLHEARITSQLMHPAIIPIYSIHSENGLVYYSMPYVQGQTLKQLLKQAKQAAVSRDAYGSIPSLTRHFLQLCQAVAYSHAKGVLHRDLKPENIIIGPYGQVFILDWGLAKVIDEEEKEEEISLPEESSRLTRLGKVVGTISHMAPERAMGAPASVQTDIYSLGVILYQILTLTLPFKRKSLQAFKKSWKKEQLIPPDILAPYRDVPQLLSEVVKKCLSADPQARYSRVDELIVSLENYLEGKSEWFSVKKLDIHRKADWQFQENILIPEHTAITRATEVSDWVSLMISQEAFHDNLKIEATIRIGKKGHGIGFIFSVPDATEPRFYSEGYCLWIAAEQGLAKSTRLLLSSVNVLEAPEIVLKAGSPYHIRIEKIEDRIHFYLNDVLQFSYVSHHPVIGTHVGILSRDADFEIDAFEVFVGSQNIEITCLAVPDAFLACKMYDRALSEYRRLGEAFPGRQEGREALFRAGMTILEQAKDSKTEEARHHFFDLAHEEFSKLRSTPGAPLEYLGKSFVYKELNDFEDEAKCFELALRRYKNNPLLSILEEQLVFRMHETSRQNRVAAYHFIGIVVRFLKEWAERSPAAKLLSSLQKNWEKPFFILHTNEMQDPELERLSLCIGVGFWLAKPHILIESVEDLLARPIVCMSYLADTIFCLVEIGDYAGARAMLERVRAILSENEQRRYEGSLHLMELLIKTENSFLDGLSWLKTRSKKELTQEEERLVWFLARHAIDREDPLASDIVATLHFQPNQEAIDALIAEHLLYRGDLVGVAMLFQKYPQERMLQESSPLYFVYGCFIAAKEGIQEALSFFSKALDIAFPRSWVLGAHFLASKIHMTPAGWFSRSFLWERRALYQQLALFWHAAKDSEKAKYWKSLTKMEYVS